MKSEPVAMSAQLHQAVLYLKTQVSAMVALCCYLDLRQNCSHIYTSFTECWQYLQTGNMLK